MVLHGGFAGLTGDRQVIDSLGPELEEIVGNEVFVELRHRLVGSRGPDEPSR